MFDQRFVHTIIFNREFKMKLGFFTRPVHPVGKNWQKSLNEDRQAILLADELEFVEAYAGEHLSDSAENITSCT